MKKITITGGSGFIGTNLISCLQNKGYKIQNLDSHPPKNNDLINSWESVDILNYKRLQEKITSFSPDILIHLAAVTDLDGSNSEYYAANTKGTENIIEICDSLKSLKKVIFTSSMYVCKPGYIPKDYNDYHPHTAYGQSKVDGELLVKEIDNVHYNWFIIRPTSIWGPWFGIPYIDFFDVVYKGRYVDFGKACTKTYGYIENAIFQIEKLLNAEDKYTHKQTFYIGDNPPIQISEWGNEISIEMGKGPIKKIPYSLIKFASKIGDILIKTGVKFPISSFRLKNMTTNNILPLENLYDVVGEPPIKRLEGVQKTLLWLQKHKNYNYLNK
ncbi:NAD(P)-dependent oxidoreductase [Maribacter sp. M208]|uniref:NAD-dependent epimerase/dehydratase family protein n=1 Tax=Maribacter huludaoensis TaxID=3030010 RepID=UPI0023EE2760|nr:NAD(P)-dependent oxidoreductase [Maribacter huludaoensis]MDF4221140.1 NAD(P)-dependent oxidoreductase [Maribacter huludaoensis]